MQTHWRPHFNTEQADHRGRCSLGEARGCVSSPPGFWKPSLIWYKNRSVEEVPCERRRSGGRKLEGFSKEPCPGPTHSSSLSAGPSKSDFNLTSNQKQNKHRKRQTLILTSLSSITYLCSFALVTDTVVTSQTSSYVLPVFLMTQLTKIHLLTYCNLSLKLLQHSERNAWLSYGTVSIFSLLLLKIDFSPYNIFCLLFRLPLPLPVPPHLTSSRLDPLPFCLSLGNRKTSKG